MYKTFLLTLLCFSAFGQPVSVGVIGGVPISDAFETFKGNTASYATNTHRYIVGPAFQLHFPLRFTVEVDGLYKRLGYQYNASSPTQRVQANAVANAWEFPVMGKFEFFPGPIRPFIGAGASFRHITDVKQVRQVISFPGNLVGVSTIDNPPEFNKDSDIGFVFSGGVAFKAGRLRIAPELRYTRWGGENFRDPIAALLRTNRNQGDFLLGITF